jgi:hypothetical protein
VGRCNGATKLTRRRLIESGVRAGVGLVVGTRLGAVASGPPLARAAADLRIGIYGYMPQVVPFDQIVKTYEQGHPGVNITVDPIGGSASPDWPSIVRRFTLEARQRRSSVDLLIGPTPWIEPAPLAQTGAIEPFDALVPKGVFNDLYRPVLREATYSDGKVYVAVVVGRHRPDLPAVVPPGRGRDRQVCSYRFSSRSPSSRTTRTAFGTWRIRRSRRRSS